MDGGALLGAPLLLALDLVTLYAAGSYAMGRVVGFAGSGGTLGRSAFYLLVSPGVVLHQGAHYLACLITGTKVVRFAPFSSQRSADGRLVLAYVRHERRTFAIRAIIGLAPVLLTPGVAERRSLGHRPLWGKGLRRTAALPIPSSRPPMHLLLPSRRALSHRAPREATPRSISIPTTKGRDTNETSVVMPQSPPTSMRYQATGPRLLSQPHQKESIG
jgi:hypothetical protein